MKSFRYIVLLSLFPLALTSCGFRFDYSRLQNLHPEPWQNAVRGRTLAILAVRVPPSSLRLQMIVIIAWICKVGITVDITIA